MADETTERKRTPHKVTVRSYPKIVLMYPTLIAALAAGVLSNFWGETAEGEPISTWSLIFLMVCGLNLIVLSFDFPRTTSLTLVFLIIAIVCLGLWLNSQVYPVFDTLKDLVDKLDPVANHQFYYLLAAGLIIMYIFVFIATRFDYWEVMHNELLHHHGILGNVNRYPAPQLKLEKEITDVFEFFLLRSGRLLIHPSSERRAILLENVPNINTREQEIQELLRVLSVHIQEHEYPASEE